MMFRMRGALAAILAAGVCLLGGAPASALTVSPSGTFTAASGTFTLRQASNGQQLSCSSLFMPFSLAGDGIGSIAAASLLAGNCASAVYGTYVWTQLVAWPVVVQHQPSRVEVVWGVPGDGLRIAYPGCTYWLTGSFATSAAAPSLPASITTSTSLPVAASRFVVGRNNGGPLCGFHPVGLTATVAATFWLSRALTVSG